MPNQPDQYKLENRDRSDNGRQSNRQFLDAAHRLKFRVALPLCHRQRPDRRRDDAHHRRSRRAELALKKGADGKTYLGFNAPPGDPADREVVGLTPKLMVMKFVDPDTNSRYGTFVYVRC